MWGRLHIPSDMQGMRLCYCHSPEEHGPGRCHHVALTSGPWHQCYCIATNRTAQGCYWQKAGHQESGIQEEECKNTQTLCWGGWVLLAAQSSTNIRRTTILTATFFYSTPGSGSSKHPYIGADTSLWLSPVQAWQCLLPLASAMHLVVWPQFDPQRQLVITNAITVTLLPTHKQALEASFRVYID